MEIKARRIYYSVFIIIFLILAPTLLLYSLGYRYDSARHTLYQTGLIDIKTKPNGASLYVNGNLIGKTNLVVPNLKPGYYALEMTKDGYLTWQKEIEVVASQTAIFGHIVLFQDNIEPRLIVKEVKSLSLSNDSQRFIYQDTNNNLWLSDLSGSVQPVSPNNTFPVSTFQWSASDEYCLITTQNNNYYFSLANPEQEYSLQNVTQITSAIKSFKWDKRVDSFLYFINQEQIWRYDLDKDNLISTEFNFRIIDYLTDSNNLYILGDQNGTKLYKYNWSDSALEILADFQTNDLNFINSYNSDNYLFINDIDNQQTRIFSLSENSFLAELPLIQFVQISASQEQVLLYDQHQIWLWDKNSQEKNLLTRFVSPINNVTYYEDQPYLFFSNEKQLKVIELDNRNRLIQSIWSGDIASIIPLNKNKLLIVEANPTKTPTYNLLELTIH